MNTSRANAKITDRAFKSAMYDGMAQIGKALASGVRVELLDLLSQGPRTVEALAGEIGQSVANTSQHLQKLTRARLVATRRDGTFIIYSLIDPGVADLVRALRITGQTHVLEMSDAMANFMAGRSAHAPISRHELRDLLDQNAVTVIDVRPAGEYHAGHLRGALSFPLPELEERLSELPGGKDIVAYCRGPFCVMAIDAVDILGHHGRPARHAALGLADFRALGLELAPEPQQKTPTR